MSGSKVDVWVEIPLHEPKEESKFSKLNKRRSTVINNELATRYEKGWVSHEAYMAADLMRKAAENRAAIEETMKAVTRKHSGAMDVNDGDIDVTVTLYATGEERLARLTNLQSVNSEHLVKQCSDLTGLTHMEEANILHSLHHRYNNNGYYTNIASILIAINPYKALPIYDSVHMMKYRSTNKSGKTQGNSPHVFAVAEEAYAAITAAYSKRRQNAPKNQSMIVCGESGSGKTESSKYLMRYLANRTYNLEDSSDVSQMSEIERQVIEANVILESIGNANTLLNHNSSRFGKFTKVYMQTQATLPEDNKKDIGKVVGAATSTYLLEKSRVVRQNKGERNFHVFYQLCNGTSDSEKKTFGLDGVSASNFHYLRQGDTFEVKGIDDKEWFIAFKKALDIVHVTQEMQEQFFETIASVIHLGNIEFEGDGTSADGSVVTGSSTSSLETAARLLGIGSDDLRTRLLTTNVKIVRDVVQKQLNPRDARINRDSIARALYSDVFDWVVAQINLALVGTGEYSWIGILDVFGFESFENNSFEQFCINFANERLQQHFNYSILLSEQREYALEGIMWEVMEIPDYSTTIELVSGKVSGILPLLDSSCKLKSATPEAFVGSIFDTHRKHGNLRGLPRTGGPKQIKRGEGFGIIHYAGVVYYNADEFLIKNTDSTDPDTIKLLQSSSKQAVVDIVSINQEKEEAEPSGIHPGEKPKPKKRNTRFSSVSGTFTKQLGTLMTTLSDTNSFFVRCVKPNTKKEAGVFDPIYVRPQLKCGGLVEAVKMLKKGFPTRVTFDEIYAQYSPLLNPQPAFELNKRDFSQAVLSLFDLQRSEYQLGLTKVFFKAGRRAFLETVMNRDAKLSPEDMEQLMYFLMQKRWQRLLATTKAAVLCSIYIRRIRSVNKFVKAVRVAVVYRKSLHKLLWKVREKRVKRFALDVQAALSAIAASQSMAADIEADRLEKQMIAEERQRQLEAQEKKEQAEAEREQQRAEKAAKMKEMREQERVEWEKKESERLRQEALAALEPIIPAAGVKIPGLEIGTTISGSHGTFLVTEEGLKPQEIDSPLAGGLPPMLAQVLPQTSDIQHWLEEYLDIEFEDELFISLDDGILLLELVSTIKPSLAMEPHEQITDVTINDHFEKFNHIAMTLGIDPRYTLHPEYLETKDGQVKVLKCLNMLRYLSSQSDPRRLTSRTSNASEDTDPYVRIRQLEGEVANLHDRMASIIEENERLQEAVVKLDEINRKMVVDLMKELSSRSDTQRPAQPSATPAPESDVFIRPGTKTRGRLGSTQGRNSQDCLVM